MTANLRLRVPFHHWIPFLSILQQPRMRRNVRSIPITVMESCIPISVEVFHLLLLMINTVVEDIDINTYTYILRHSIFILI